MRKQIALGVWGLLLLPSGAATSQEGFRDIVSVNVEVHYEPGVTEMQARTVADYLERDYDYLRKSVGLDLGRRLEVRIYDSPGRYRSAVQRERSSTGATYYRGVLHVQHPGVLEEKRILSQSLSYALAAALLDSAAAKGCPRWLVEAFAVYQSGETADLTPPARVAPAYFSDLDEDIQQYPDRPGRDDVHWFLGMTMRFFIDRFGEEKALGVFRGFDGKKSLEEVFKGSFDLDLAALEKAWSGYVASMLPQPPQR
jgi:hypothetical protein